MLKFYLVFMTLKNIIYFLGAALLSTPAPERFLHPFVPEESKYTLKQHKNRALGY